MIKSNLSIQSLFKSALLLVVCFAFVTSHAQVLFYDGFDTGISSENWNTTYGWSAADGKAINDVGGTSSFLTSVPSFSATDYYVETFAGPFKSGYYREYFLLFGLQGGNDNTGYGIRIDATFGKIRLVKSTDNFYFPEVISVVDTILSDSSDYAIRIEHSTNGDINVFFAEEGDSYPNDPILSGNDQSYSTLGRIGWLPSSETFPELFYLDFMRAGQLSSTLFCDSFNGNDISSFWINDGSWTIQDSAAFNNSYGDALLTAPAFNEPSYVLETTVSNLVTGYYRAYNLFFGVQDNDANFGYTFEIDAYGLENILSLGVSDGNYYYPTTLDWEPFPTDPTRDYHFRIEKYDNGLIQVYLDEGTGYGDEPLLEAIDTTYPTLGQFGWGARTETDDEDFFVKDICVTVPDIQKTALEKSPQSTNILAYYTREVQEYELATMAVGTKHYLDRNYVITSLPEYLEGATFLKTANNDKAKTTDDYVLYAYFEQPTVAYLAYDPRGSVLPEWLNHEEWIKTDDVIGSTDIGTSYFEIYRRNLLHNYFYTGHHSIAVGANLASPAVGAEANYFIAFTNAPARVRYEAEGATLSGPVVANNHFGFSASGFADYINPTNDFIEWDIYIEAPNTYTFDFIYALGAGYNRDLQLAIDGNVVSLVSFDPTIQWTRWKIEGGIRGFMDTGAHTVRLTATGNSGPNLDYLEVYPTYIGATIFIPSAIVAVQPPEDSNPDIVSLTSSLGQDIPAIHAYPNPGSKTLTLTIENLQQSAAIRIFDMQGKEMENFSIWSDGLSDVSLLRQIDAGQWSSGIYVISLQTIDGLITTKWLKE